MKMGLQSNLPATANRGKPTVPVPAKFVPVRRVTSRPGRVSPALLGSLALNAALLAGLGYTQFARPNATPTPTPESGSVAQDSVQALGRLQPAGGLVSVFGPPGERVVSLAVKLGAEVRPGEPLLTLSGEAERGLTLKALDAQIGEAKALREAATRAKTAKLADVDAEVRQAKAKLGADLAALDARLEVVTLQEGRAAGELARLVKVKAEGAPVAEQDLVQLRTAAAQAKAELDAIRVQKSKAVEQQVAGEEAAVAKRATLLAEADRALAQIPLESLAASRLVALQKVADAAVTAPAAGRVVKLAARVGDTLTTMPALQLADTGRMVVVAEVYESSVPTLRGWLAGGREVKVEVAARVEGAKPTTLVGAARLAGVAPMIAKNSVFPLGPREDTDRRVVEVEVQLDDSSSRLAADFIGLQVAVKFLAPAK